MWIEQIFLFASTKNIGLHRKKSLHKACKDKTLPSVDYCFRTAVVHTAHQLVVLCSIWHSLMRKLLYQLCISWKSLSNIEENFISGRHKVVSVNALLLQTQNASLLIIQFFFLFSAKSFISYPPVSKVTER